jgi:hypothetical protein
MTYQPEEAAHAATSGSASAVTAQRVGSVGSFLLAASGLVAQLIYLIGDLRDAQGVVAYRVADVLYGPIWAAGVVVAFAALRERIGDRGARRMSLAFLLAVLAAATMLIIASLRASNRGYHVHHPELNLEHSTPVLVVWSTLVAALSTAGWHFMGWALLLTGSAGWESRRLPRALCALYLFAGVVSLFVFAYPGQDETAFLLAVIWGTWQGIVLWMGSTAPPAAPPN